jgi:hypothetical protein
MAMKKKFLGLALAAAVALPATSVYAAPNVTEVDDKKVLNMEATDTGNVTVPVTGTVKKSDGSLPEGKIEVELPTAMAFIVDQNGGVTETEYTISNNSKNVDIKLSVDSFTGGFSGSDGSGDGIKIMTEDALTEDNKNQHYRNQVSLTLTKTNGVDTLDLGNVNKLTETEKVLGKIDAGTHTKLKLKGRAGSKASTGASLPAGTDVDTKGAQQEFSLVFSIKKSS